VQSQRRAFLHSLGLGVENPPKLGDLIVREVRAVALARDAQTLLEGLDDVVVGHAKIFGKLVDAQHERAYLIGLGIRKSFGI